MSHVESLHEVYLQLSKNSFDLKIMLDRLNNFYSNTATSTEKIQLLIGQPVCVNDNDVWYRGIVTNIDDDLDMFTVRLVDYGRVITVKQEFVKPLDSQFLESHPLALKCQLFDVDKITGKSS